MNKEFYDKYSKDLECSSCITLTRCMNEDRPLCTRGYIKFQEDAAITMQKQIIEKEKEIEELKKGVYKVTLGTTPSNQIDFTENFYVIQNQTAIAELEKAKEIFEKDYQGCRDFVELYAVFLTHIDQQIRSLKGEK